jgi:hypothetical protein
MTKADLVNNLGTIAKSGTKVRLGWRSFSCVVIFLGLHGGTQFWC